MDWVKQRTDYYLKAPVAMGDDAMEVMLERGRALAGQLEQHGFIPDSLLHHLTRRPGHARKLAQALVDADLWERVAGGYVIVGWAEDQEALEKEVARKERDAARKRSKRAANRSSGDVSADAGTDSPLDSSRASDLDQDLETAAATPPPTLDPMLAGLQAVMHRYTKLRHIRFDATPADKVAEIRDLIELHGDEKLVEIALKAPEDVAHVGWFLGSWRALPAPGQRLRAVDQRFCTNHTWVVLSPAGTCTACASERLEGAHA